MRFSRLALVGATLLLTALSTMGCYKATFMTDPNVVKGEEHDEWTDFYIFGLVGTEEFNVKDFCPNGNVAQVRTGGNVGTALVGALTLGIYAPRKVYVTCSAGGPAAPAAAPAAANKQLTIYADAAGKPIRVERTQSDSTRVVAIVPVEGARNQWVASAKNEVRP